MGDHGQSSTPSAERLPLSRSQMNIWNLERTHPGLPINNICSTLNITGYLDVVLLQQAMLALIGATPALRTRVTTDGSTPLQYITDDVPARIPYFDFSLTGSEGVDEWSLSIARETMPLLDTPLYACALFKRSNGTGGVLLKTHHLISDAWSQGLMLNRLADMYLALLSHRPLDEKPSPSYTAHIEAEQAYLDSPQHGRDRAFWEGALRDLPGSAAKEHEYATVSPIGRRASYPLPERLSRQIAAFCDRENTSPFGVFYMALAIYLRRVRGQETSCIGVPVINRRTYAEKQTVGMFVTTLPFVGSFDERLSFAALNEKVRADWYEMLRHQQLPFGEIQQIAQENGFSTGKLFDIALSFQNGRMVAGEHSSVSFEGRWQYSGYQAEALCMHISSRTGDGGFLIDYDYLTQLFSAAEIDVLHAYLVNLLTDALASPEKAVADLRILGGPEEERVLYTFNATAAPLPEERLPEALGRVAQTHASRVAIIDDGERVSYDALMARARARVDMLRAVLPGEGHVVAIQMPAGAELFVSICAVILSGNAWLLLDADQPRGRVDALLRQAGVAAHMTPDGIALQDVQEDAFAPPPDGDPIAYLVCTSGSTGEPKAVQVGQRSLLNFAAAMRPLYGRGGVLCACSISFDAFLIESVCALLSARTIIIAGDRHRHEPAVLAKLIRSYAVGFLCFTPSRLAAYIKEPAFVRALVGVESVVCGGEAFPEELLQRLLELTDARLYNQYGPSEATIGVSFLQMNAAPQVTIGRPMRNCRLYVLDAGGKPQPIGAAGELYIAGPCLAHGYRGDAAMTEDRFVPDPYGGGRMYRTGDLARWNERGEIVFLGRRDSQLKLHGYRIEPTEIEARLSMHPQVTGAAVRVFDDADGHRLLAAYYTAAQALDGDDLLAFAATYLPRYMLPTYTRQLDALPVTQNGKTDYRALPAPDIRVGSEAAANDGEARLLGIWRRVLGRDIDVNADYFLSGGDSLNAIEMLMIIERDFGRAPTMGDLYAHSTVRRLAALLARGGVPKETPVAREGIPRAPEQASYPLTPAQRRFYVLHAMDSTGIAYNMPGAFRPSGPIDCARLRDAFARLIALDEMLRTGFHMEGGVLSQSIVPEVAFDIEDAPGASLEAAFRAFVRPFDLSRPPLLRVGLWRDEDGGDVLMMDMHHIISDGLSGALLFERLDALYRGETPTMPALRYRDWACWLDARDAATLDPQRAYWRAQLAGAPLETDLPFDLPHAGGADLRGANVRIPLGAALSRACDAFCEARRVTPYAFFAAMFGTLLARLSGQEDILVGTPVSGRRAPELQGVTGLFINTLPLRMRCAAGVPFERLLESTRDAAAAMLDNQALSFDEILTLAGVPRDSGQNPLYNVLFSMVPVPAGGMPLGDIHLTQVEIDPGIAKLPLSLEGMAGPDGYAFRLEYATELLMPETAALWGRAFEASVRAVLERPGLPVDELPAVATVDRIRLIDRPNRLHTPFDPAPTPHRIEEMAAIHPDHPAVVWGDGLQYTYAQLIARADALAAQLVDCGAQPGDRIGLLHRRDGDLITALLGIWRAGCVYVPLEPAYPPERMRTMLRTAEAALLLCGEGIAPPDDLPCPSVSARFDAAPLPIPAEAELAYVLFTSGSTGDPKGVMVGHTALSNLLIDGERVLAGGSRVLCAANVIFDIFATEVWLPLAAGMTVVMADEEEMLLPWQLARRMRESRVDIAQLTPSRMQLCLGDKDFTAALAPLHAVLLIGEPVTQPLLDALRAACPGRIINQYGPTEATVFCSWADLAHEPTLHIGKPTANCRFYALDPQGHMVPPTARGELYIAGACLADGYIGRQDLTDAAFVPDPFVPGERMYRSGDFVRLRADGNWDFLGRRDRQIKLDGHRIEIEEIAARLLRSGQAKEAAVVPIERNGAVRALRAIIVPDASYNPATLEAYLAENLPAYMIPGTIDAVDAFPRTANGKTDLRALLAMEKAPVAPKAPAPVETPPAPAPAASPATLEAIRTVWQAVLDTQAIDENSSFFRQGGTSLTALMVLSRYYQQGWTMSMNDFYAHPTLRGQATLLGAPEPSTGPAADTALSRHLPATARRPVKAGITLLTGATGFFGAHVLGALCARGERVVCLVRDEGRFAETCAAYLGGTPQGVETVVGDITRPWFGLSLDDYTALATRIARVWHCAADVRHYAADDAIERVNVLGTEHVLAFARDAEAWLGHVSTTSVCGDSVPGAPSYPVPFTERDLDIGQNWRDNPYVRSKALAEARVAAAMEAGLSAQIIRVGRLCARARDGVFQRNPDTNAFYRTMRGLIELGAAPEGWAATPLDMTPVDLCAEAAVRLADTNAGAVHVATPWPVTPAELLARAGGRVAILPDEAFAALLRARLAGEASPNLRSLAEVFFTGGHAAPQVRLEMWRTLDLLSAAGFSWPKPDPATLTRCLDI